MCIIVPQYKVKKKKERVLLFCNIFSKCEFPLPGAVHFLLVSHFINGYHLVIFKSLLFLGTSLVVQWLRVRLPGASLVAQWLRICLPVQGTRVRALVRKIPHAMEQLSPRATTTEPTCHNYWSPYAWSPCSKRKATAMRSPCTTMKSSPCSPQLEKAHAQQRRPNAAKNK